MKVSRVHQSSNVVVVNAEGNILQYRHTITIHQAQELNKRMSRLVYKGECRINLHHWTLICGPLGEHRPSSSNSKHIETGTYTSKGIMPGHIRSAYWREGTILIKATVVNKEKLSSAVLSAYNAAIAEYNREIAKLNPGVPLMTYSQFINSAKEA